jgi:hypothetical protein
MSKVGQGQLHDADSPEKFPVILADELDGLQKITVQNLRLRIQPKLFCNAWKQYGDYPQVVLPDQRTELALGDLVSGEEREAYAKACQEIEKLREPGHHERLVRR